MWHKMQYLWCFVSRQFYMREKSTTGYIYYIIYMTTFCCTSRVFIHQPIQSGPRDIQLIYLWIPNTGLFRVIWSIRFLCIYFTDVKWLHEILFFSCVYSSTFKERAMYIFGANPNFWKTVAKFERFLASTFLYWRWCI